MPDRIIRDELLDSDRWLDLPTDTDRLAFVGMRLRSDDFGNFEGGPRLARFIKTFTQCKTDETVATTLTHLVDADLIRAYKGPDDRPFWHIPRSRPTGSYLVRKCPPSPWCNPDVKLGKHVRSIRNQGHAKNITVTSPQCTSDVSQGVGIGIGKGVGVDLTRALVDAVDNSTALTTSSTATPQVKTIVEKLTVNGEGPKPRSRDDQLAYVKAQTGKR